MSKLLKTPDKMREVVLKNTCLCKNCVHTTRRIISNGMCNGKYNKHYCNYILHTGKSRIPIEKEQGTYGNPDRCACKETRKKVNTNGSSKTV